MTRESSLLLTEHRTLFILFLFNFFCLLYFHLICFLFILIGWFAQNRIQRFSLYTMEAYGHCIWSLLFLFLFLFHFWLRSLRLWTWAPNTYTMDCGTWNRQQIEYFYLTFSNNETSGISCICVIFLTENHDVQSQLLVKAFHSCMYCKCVCTMYIFFGSPIFCSSLLRFRTKYFPFFSLISICVLVALCPFFPKRALDVLHIYKLMSVINIFVEFSVCFFDIFYIFLSHLPYFRLLLHL